MRSARIDSASGFRLPHSCTNIDILTARFIGHSSKATVKLLTITSHRNLPPDTHSACISSSESV
ncbi:hypothetical protein PHBOTO_005589 [Pseudozyma hubeiensis]|nr:hypothetical protein PHBOTO_005589 [Pseudozyma hubeiensis]